MVKPFTAPHEGMSKKQSCSQYECFCVIFVAFKPCFLKTLSLGFCRVCVRSRCWDACMVVDGGTSFEFNDGAIASIMIDTEDALCTVLLEE